MKSCEEGNYFFHGTFLLWSEVSSTTLISWPVTPLFKFMICNDFKYFYEKTCQQILQNFLNTTYYTALPMKWGVPMVKSE